MKVQIGQKGIYKLGMESITFTEFITNKSISLATTGERLVVVQGRDQNEFCFTATKSAINLWDFGLKVCKCTYFLDSAELIEMTVIPGYLVVISDQPHKFQLFSADPFELVQEFSNETELLAVVSSIMQPTKPQPSQVERIKLRHQGELSKYKNELSSLKSHRDRLLSDLEQAEADLLLAKVSIKKLMNELVKNEKVDVEALTTSLTRASLKSRRSVSQIPSLRHSWSIPLLGITINPLKEAKED